MEKKQAYSTLPQGRNKQHHSRNMYILALYIPIYYIYIVSIYYRIESSDLTEGARKMRSGVYKQEGSHCFIYI